MISWLNHQYGDGPPLIFETMLFKSKDDLDALDFERYSTEAEAVAGHEAMVERWKEPLTMTQEQQAATGGIADVMALEPTSDPKKRIRVNVTTSVKGVHSFDVTVEFTDPEDVSWTDLGDQALAESERLVVELDKRYPAPEAG